MINRRLLLMLQVVIVLCFACKPRGFNESVNTSVAFSEDRVLSVSWQCISNRQEPLNSRLNTQEEYCEWTRVSRAVDFGIPGKLMCEFNSNFDNGRPHFLTKNMKDPMYSQVFANSLPFLLGGEGIKGIFPACKETKGQCMGGDCVCGRKSDPQLCATIGAFEREGCSDVAALGLQTTKRYGGTGIVGVQLQIPEGLKKNCFYRHQQDQAGNNIAIKDVDPEKEKTFVQCFFDKTQRPEFSTCDDVATRLIVKAYFSFPTCNKVEKIQTRLEGEAPNACD